MHTSIMIYVYIFYLCKCISLLLHYLLFFGVKNKLLVLVLLRTECDGGDPSEELFRGSDRGGEKESEGVCGRLNS